MLDERTGTLVITARLKRCDRETHRSRSVAHDGFRQRNASEDASLSALPILRFRAAIAFSGNQVGDLRRALSMECVDRLLQHAIGVCDTLVLAQMLHP